LKMTSGLPCRQFSRLRMKIAGGLLTLYFEYACIQIAQQAV